MTRYKEHRLMFISSILGNDAPSTVLIIYALSSFRFRLFKGSTLELETARRFVVLR